MCFCCHRNYSFRRGWTLWVNSSSWSIISITIILIWQEHIVTHFIFLNNLLSVYCFACSLCVCISNVQKLVWCPAMDWCPPFRVCSWDRLLIYYDCVLTIRWLLTMSTLYDLFLFRFRNCNCNTELWKLYAMI